MLSSREQRKRTAISVARGLHTNIAEGATEEEDRIQQEPKRFQPLKKVGLILCTAWPPPIEAFTVSYVILSHALHLVYFCHNDWIKLTVVFFFFVVLFLDNSPDKKASPAYPFGVMDSVFALASVTTMFSNLQYCASAGGKVLSPADLILIIAYVHACEK